MEHMEYTYLIVDETKIAYKTWKPSGKPDGLFYIVHGLNESFEYYEEFAAYAVKKNKAVFMHEARGHGRTAGDPLSEQYITDAGDAGEHAIDTYRADLYHGITAAREQCPGIPVTILAHSLGTIITLSFLEHYQDQVEQVVLMGPPAPKNNREYDRLIHIGEQEIAELGGKTASSRVYQEIFSRANDRFEDNDPLAFISRDKKLNGEAIQYPFTNVIFNNHFFTHFLKTQKEVYQLANLSKIKSELPILLLSGSDDFVTDFTMGIIELGKRMKQTSHRIDVKIYPGARHSLLREINREEIMCGIINWSWKNRTDMERC